MTKHSFFKRYPLGEDRRILKRLEIHYTPKHGNWLDIAEMLAIQLLLRYNEAGMVQDLRKPVRMLSGK